MNAKSWHRPATTSIGAATVTLLAISSHAQISGESVRKSTEQPSNIRVFSPDTVRFSVDHSFISTFSSNVITSEEIQKASSADADITISGVNISQRGRWRSGLDIHDGFIGHRWTTGERHREGPLANLADFHCSSFTTSRRRAPCRVAPGSGIRCLAPAPT